MKKRGLAMAAALGGALALFLTGCGQKAAVRATYERLAYAASTRWAPTHSDTLTTQGTQQLYFLYTPETDTGGVYDLDAIRECVYSPEAGIWKPPGMENASGWRMTSDAYTTDMTPGTGVSSVLAWEAPEDGCFVLDATFTFGGTGGDGVTLSLYADTERVYSRTVSGELNEGDAVSVPIRLRAGQRVYAIADPNGSADGDVCRSVRLELTRTMPYVDDATTWGFGRGHLNGDGTRQGENGWYFLYAPAVGTDGVYDVEQLRACRFFPYEDVPESYTGVKTGNWMPGMYADVPWGRDGGVCWRQTAEGVVMPSVRPDGGTTPATAVMAWEAPEDGRYTATVSFFAVVASTGDGLTASLYADRQPIVSDRITTPGASHGGYTTTFTLKAGERFYLFFDPNADGSAGAEDLTVFIERAAANG